MLVLTQLTSTLWNERNLLESLLYRLTVEKLVLLTGNTKWLVRASNDVQSILDEIRSTEVLRAATVNELAAQLDLAPNPTLSDLIGAVEDPWREMLLEHRDAFRQLAAEIQQISEENRELLTTGARSARETLLALNLADDGYDKSGQVLAASSGARFFDKAL